MLRLVCQPVVARLGVCGVELVRDVTRSFAQPAQCQAGARRTVRPKLNGTHFVQGVSGCPTAVGAAPLFGS